jgi:hypothetical protein
MTMRQWPGSKLICDGIRTAETYSAYKAGEGLLADVKYPSRYQCSLFEGDQLPTLSLNPEILAGFSSEPSSWCLVGRVGCVLVGKVPQKVWPPL